MFMRRAGHEICCFTRPEEACRELGNNGFDLVVTDVQMPGADGFDVAEKVAETLGTTPPKVLLISGYEDTRDRMKAFSPSVVIGLLQKPFGYHELVKVLSFLEEAQTCCPGVLKGFCSHSRMQKGDGPLDWQTETTCCRYDYSDCPHYESECGVMLRQWIYNGNA
jgi:DNA-binding response OmpR family regulator